jgi:hypothetical protein
MMQLEMFKEAINSDIEYIDLKEVPIYFGDKGRRRQDLTASSAFLSSIPEGKYRVYRTGGTHALPMYEGRTDFPFITNMYTGKLITPSFSRAVYPAYNLNNGRFSKPIYLHRIFAMAFVPNATPVDRYNVDHINEDKLDYSVDNLRWVSMSENLKNVRNTARGANSKYKYYSSENYV